MIHKIRYNLIFVFLIILSLFLELNQVGLSIRNKILVATTLDYSWQLDYIERYLHGYIAGRDFIFTYGPIFQLIYSIPSIIFKIPSYISLLLAPIIMNLIFTILVIMFSKLLFKKIIDQVLFCFYLLFFVGIFAFDTRDIIRLFLPVYFSLLYAKFILNNKINLRTTLINLLPTIFGLFSYDIFIYCLGVSVVGFLLGFFIKYDNKNKQISNFLHLATIIILQLISSLIISGNLNYLLFSIDTVSNYQYVMDVPWSNNKNLILFMFPVISIILFIYIIKIKKTNNEIKNLFIFLIISALLELKTGLVRTGGGHLIKGLYPSIINTFILLFYLGQKGKKIFILLALFFSIFLPFKISFFDYFSIKSIKLIPKIINEKPDFFSLYKLPNDYYFSKNDFIKFSNLIKTNKGKVFVYPHDNFILDINNSTYNSLPIQYYAYSNSVVENKSIYMLKNNPPKFIILGIDQKSAYDLDGIPNFTRNPLFSSWMIKNFSTYYKGKNYLILEYNENKNITYNSKECTLFEIGFKINKLDNLSTRIIENLIKPPEYYVKFNGKYMRLPYTLNSKFYLIFSGYNNVNSFNKLLSNYNFGDKYNRKDLQNKIKIIKIFPFSNKQEIFDYKNSEINLTCFN